MKASNNYYNGTGGNQNSSKIAKVDPLIQSWDQLTIIPSYDDFKGFSEIPFMRIIDTLYLMGFIHIK